MSLCSLFRRGPRPEDRCAECGSPLKPWGDRTEVHQLPTQHYWEREDRKDRRTITIRSQPDPDGRATYTHIEALDGTKYVYVTDNCCSKHISFRR